MTHPTTPDLVPERTQEILMLCPTVSPLDFIHHTLPFWLVILLSCAGAVAYDLLHKLATRWAAPVTARLLEGALLVFLVLELMPLLVQAALPALATVRCLVGQ